MLKIMTDFKHFLQFLSPENQICKIDSMIHSFNKSTRKDEIINKKFHKINELKTLKKEIILNNEEYLREKYLN